MGKDPGKVLSDGDRVKLGKKMGTVRRVMSDGRSKDDPSQQLRDFRGLEFLVYEPLEAGGNTFMVRLFVVHRLSSDWVVVLGCVRSYDHCHRARSSCRRLTPYISAVSRQWRR